MENETFLNDAGETCKAIYRPDTRKWHAYSITLPHHVTVGKDSKSEAVACALAGSWLTIQELGSMIRNQAGGCL